MGDGLARPRGRRVRPKQQATTERVELVLENPAHGGAVTAHDETGRIYFVRYGIPGEKVVARVTAEQKRFSWAEVERVLEGSKDRVSDSRDPAADLAHVSRAGQLDWKRRVLQDQLQRVGGSEVSRQVQELYGEGGPEVRPAPGDGDSVAPWGRRTRAKFKVTRDGRLGVNQYRSHELVAVEDYPLLSPVFTEAGVFSDPRWRARWRPGNRVTLLAPTGSAPLVVVQKRAYDLAGTEVEPVGRWTVSTAAGDTSFDVQATGFWQTHKAAAGLLVDEVLAACKDLQGANVMELYSGAGLFTRYLAAGTRPHGRIVSLEGDSAAVADAERNMRGLVGGAPVEMFVGNVDGAAVAELQEHLPGGAQVVVLDPPREGAGAEVARAICATGCSRVVLVACDPAAGARDLKSFAEGGFRLESLRSWDLFPQTHHIEFVAALVR